MACTDCGETTQPCPGASTISFDCAVSACLSSLGVTQNMALCVAINQIALAVCSLTNTLFVHPLNEIVTGAAPLRDSSSSHFVYDKVNSIFYMLDPLTLNTALSVQTDMGGGVAQFSLTTDNSGSTGYYANITGDNVGTLQLTTAISGISKASITVIPFDAGFLHGVQIEVDGDNKVQFEPTSINLRPVNNLDYTIRFYEHGVVGGVNYFGIKGAASISANRTLVLPDDDPVAGQFLKVTSFIGGVIITEWST